MCTLPLVLLVPDHHCYHCASLTQPGVYSASKVVVVCVTARARASKGGGDARARGVCGMAGGGGGAEKVSARPAAARAQLRWPPPPPPFAPSPSPPAAAMASPIAIIAGRSSTSSEGKSAKRQTGWARRISSTRFPLVLLRGLPARACTRTRTRTRTHWNRLHRQAA
jgi:hypothetical protein